MGNRFMDLFPGAMSGGDLLYIPTPHILYDPAGRTLNSDPMPNTGSLGSGWNLPLASGTSEKVVVAGRTAAAIDQVSDASNKFLLTTTPDLVGVWAAGDGFTAVSWFHPDAAAPAGNFETIPTYHSGTTYFIIASTPGANTFRAGMRHSDGSTDYTTSEAYTFVDGWYFTVVRWNPTSGELLGQLYLEGTGLVVTASATVASRSTSPATAYDMEWPQYSPNHAAGTYIGGSAIWWKDRLSDAQVAAVMAGRYFD